MQNNNRVKLSLNCVRLFWGCLGFVLWLSCGFDNIKNVLSYLAQFEETIISGRLEI